MRVRDLQILIVTCTLILLTCAYRDNNFDPQSPLYRADSPDLFISLEFDSSQITPSQSDTIYAHTPLDITISASSKGGYNRDIDLEVLYQHYINGKQQEMNILEDPISTTLRDSGIHKLQFESSENNGTPPTVKQTFISLTHKTAPKILHFKSDKYELPIKENCQVLFTSEIVDSNSLLEKIIYTTSNVNNVTKSIMEPSAYLYDSLPYSFYVTDTGVQVITLKAFDILGRIDSMDLELHFEDDNNMKSPPIINNISYYPRQIKVMQETDFMISVTTSSAKIEKFWSYGESNVHLWTTDSSHRFINPGIYTVVVRVFDDSGSYDTDSTIVQVYPSINVAPHISNFSIEPHSGDAPLLVKFSVSATDSDGVVKIFKWILGTGYETFDDSEFSFTYWYPRKYPVTVIAFDDKWGSDTISDTITVTGEHGDKPCLTAYPVPAYIFQDIYFKLENISSDYDSTKFIWEFPSDTVETSEPQIRRNFLYYGNYMIKLTVVNDSTRTFTVPIKIWDDRY